MKCERQIIHLHCSKRTGLQYLTQYKTEHNSWPQGAQEAPSSHISSVSPSSAGHPTACADCFTSMPAQGSHRPWEHCFAASSPASLGAAPKDELRTPCWWALLQKASPRGVGAWERAAPVCASSLLCTWHKEAPGLKNPHVLLQHQCKHSRKPRVLPQL